MRYLVVCFSLYAGRSVTTDFRLVALLIGRLLGMVYRQVLVMDTDTGDLIALHGAAPRDRASVDAKGGWYSANQDRALLPRQSSMQPPVPVIAARTADANRAYVNQYRV